MLARGCYAFWMIFQIEKGFDPVMNAPLAPSCIPNHQPLYHWAESSFAYMDQVDAMGVLSPCSWQRPRFFAPLLTVVRPKHLREALLSGEPPGADAARPPLRSFHLWLGLLSAVGCSTPAAEQRPASRPPRSGVLVFYR